MLAVGIRKSCLLQIVISYIVRPPVNIGKLEKASYSRLAVRIYRCLLFLVVALLWSVGDNDIGEIFLSDSTDCE